MPEYIVTMYTQGTFEVVVCADTEAAAINLAFSSSKEWPDESDWDFDNFKVIQVTSEDGTVTDH